MITFTIKTLGCKVNQSEAEKIQQSLCQAGFSCTSDMQNLDLIIINTCAVTHIAEKKSRQLIRKATKLNPQAKLFVTGCATKTDLKRLREILQVEFIHTDKKLLAEQITQQYAEKISTPFYHAPPPHRNTKPASHPGVSTGPGRLRKLLLLLYHPSHPRP